MRLGFKFFFLLMDVQSLHHHLFEKTIHPLLNLFCFSVKIIFCGVIPGFHILFHWSLCRTLRQYQVLCQDLCIHYLQVLYQLQDFCSSFTEEEVKLWYVSDSKPKLEL